MHPTRSASFTQGSIPKILFSKTMAMLMGLMGMLIFNLTDTYFMSLLGTMELAALTYTFPVVMSIMALSMGLGMGASTLISKEIGMGNWAKAQRLTTDALLLSLIAVAFFSLLGFLLMEPIFRALGADEKTLPLVIAYMNIWYGGMIFLTIPMVGNSCTRATGDMKTPSLIMLAGMLVNLALDPILIFGWGPFPRLEMQGAAWATLISRVLTMGISLYVLIYKDHLLALHWPDASEFKASVKEILHLSLPAASTNLILPLGMGVVTGLIASFGQEAVAAFGVAGRIEMFAFSVVMSLATVMSPFLGQNWGAKSFERVEQGFKTAIIFTMFWGLFCAILFSVLGNRLAHIFSTDPKVISIIVHYLMIVSWGYGLHSILTLSNAPLNVLGKPMWASGLNLSHVFLLYIPLSFGLSHYWKLEGIFVAHLLAKIISGILATFLIYRIYHQQKAKVLEQN